MSVLIRLGGAGYGFARVVLPLPALPGIAALKTMNMSYWMLLMVKHDAKH
jgi:hypothetical protein